MNTYSMPENAALGASSPSDENSPGSLIQAPSEDRTASLRHVTSCLHAFKVNMPTTANSHRDNRLLNLLIIHLSRYYSYPILRQLSVIIRQYVSLPRKPRSLSENSVVGPRASNFFGWQRRRSRRCWFYRRYSRMQTGGKRAARSQIEFSDRLLGKRRTSPAPQPGASPISHQDGGTPCPFDTV